MFRKFAAHTAALAQHWFETPVQSIHVTQQGAYSTTADGACPVSFQSGAVAYVKPRPGPAMNLLVAREKIAADLGHLLELPVAPVVVREVDVPGGWPNHTAMSLSCLARARPWGPGDPARLAAAGPALEALRVFWTWIGDSDHNAHPNNLLFQADADGAVELLAIDHAYAMCHGNLANPLTVGECNGYGTKGIPAFDNARRQMADAIVGLDDAAIENAVRRLNVILNPGEQDRILNVLRSRSSALIKPLT